MASFFKKKGKNNAFFNLLLHGTLKYSQNLGASQEIKVDRISL